MIEFLNCDLQHWVEQAQLESEKTFRQAVHTILLAVSSDNTLNADMVLKGGILMAIRYHSQRFTKDIDFSTAKNLTDTLTEESLKNKIDSDLLEAVEFLDYGMDCKVQSCKLQPKNPQASFPSYKIKIGYAYKGSKQHKGLLARNSTNIVSIDYSMNEEVLDYQVLCLGQEGQLKAYELTELIAEKLRSLLQQKTRNRYRRQDVYDLNYLIETTGNFEEIELITILKAFKIKCIARGIDPNESSILDTEVSLRAQAEYASLVDELGSDLPDFDASFNRIVGLYQSLPWGK